MGFCACLKVKHFLGSDDDEQIDSDIEQKILAINFDEKLYRELEELQFEGKNDEIWKVVRCTAFN